MNQCKPFINDLTFRAADLKSSEEVRNPGALITNISNCIITKLSYYFQHINHLWKGVLLESGNKPLKIKCFYTFLFS